MSQELRIENAKLFDRIVFGKEHYEFSEMADSPCRRIGQDKWLKRSLRKGKISQKLYDREKKRIEEAGAQTVLAKEKETIQKIAGSPNPVLNVRGKHIVISLRCPCCETEGENTFGNISFRPLRKDRKGFLYFECPSCKEHLQYDPVTGEIRTRKGLLGFLFGRFS